MELISDADLSSTQSEKQKASTKPIALGSNSEHKDLIARRRSRSLDRNNPKEKRSARPSSAAVSRN